MYMDSGMIEREVLYQRRLFEAEAAKREAERRRAKAVEENRKADRAAQEAVLRMRELERAAATRGRCAGSSTISNYCGVPSTIIPGRLTPTNQMFPYPPPLYNLPVPAAQYTGELYAEAVAPGCGCHGGGNRRKRQLKHDTQRLEFDARNVGWNAVRGDVQVIDRDARNLY